MRFEFVEDDLSIYGFLYDEFSFHGQRTLVKGSAFQAKLRDDFQRRPQRKRGIVSIDYPEVGRSAPLAHEEPRSPVRPLITGASALVVQAKTAPLSLLGFRRAVRLAEAQGRPSEEPGREPSQRDVRVSELPQSVQVEEVDARPPEAPVQAAPETIKVILSSLLLLGVLELLEGCSTRDRTRVFFDPPESPNSLLVRSSPSQVARILLEGHSSPSKMVFKLVFKSHQGDIQIPLICYSNTTRVVFKFHHSGIQIPPGWYSSPTRVVFKSYQGGVRVPPGWYSNTSKPPFKYHQSGIQIPPGWYSSPIGVVLKSHHGGWCSPLTRLPFVLEIPLEIQPRHPLGRVARGLGDAEDIDGSSPLERERERGVGPRASTVSRRYNVLPLLGPNLICKYRSGGAGRRGAETGRATRLRSCVVNADKKKPFQCQKCGRGFTLKRNKDRHVNYECGHEPRFQCPYCGLRSKQTSPVYAHIRKKHPEEESCKAFETEAGNREQPDSSPSVSRSLPNYYSQARVRNAYAKGSFADCFRKPFGCPKCGRCFTVKGNMTRHLKYECGQAPRFQCPYCEFRSKQTSNVMSHIRTRHTGQRVYVVHLKYEN
ncbi:hypothetical protein KM043_007667 [Ampulex compressa]|nr:hypothetical protein KM043_007667 [Ampulex compressa]